MESRKALRARFVPPDGGYGWLVAFAAFLVQFWITGLLKSFGVIYMEIMLLHPTASASIASWIPAILSTLGLVLSPLSSGLCQRFSCRSVVFVGGLFCCVGVSLSYFATEVEHFLLTFGVLTGIGAGLSTTPGIIMTSLYFNKHRALANGLCVAGTAVGSMLLPILMETLLPRFGFKGSVLILGACMLHICLSAVIYRPIEIHQAIVESERKTTDLPTIHNFTPIPIIIDSGNDDHSSDFNSPTTHEDSESSPSLKKKKNQLSPHNLSPISSMMHSVEDLTTDSTICYTDFRRQMAKKTASKTDVLSSLSQHQSKKNKKRKLSKICSIFKCIDLTLTTNPLFLLLASTVMLMAVGVPLALFYLPSYANSQGLDKSDCSLLISVGAVFDLITRLALGYVADLNLFSNYKAYCLSLLTSALAIFCVPFATTFLSFAIIIAFYGIGVGAWFLLTPVLLTENHGTESIGSSYGLSRLFQGFMSLIVPPLVGFSKDATGDYVIGFFGMGVSMFVGAILILFQPCLLRYRKKN